MHHVELAARTDFEVRSPLASDQLPVGGKAALEGANDGGPYGDHPTGLINGGDRRRRQVVALGKREGRVKDGVARGREARRVGQRSQPDPAPPQGM